MLYYGLACIDRVIGVVYEKEADGFIAKDDSMNAAFEVASLKVINQESLVCGVSGMIYNPWHSPAVAVIDVSILEIILPSDSLHFACPSFYLWESLKRSNGMPETE